MPNYTPKTAKELFEDACSVIQGAYGKDEPGPCREYFCIADTKGGAIPMVNGAFDVDLVPLSKLKPGLSKDVHAELKVQVVRAKAMKAAWRAFDSAQEKSRAKWEAKNKK